MDTSYDSAISECNPGPEIKERFFESFISPLIKDKKSIRDFSYFFHQGYIAWRLKITKEDLEQVKFIEWLCEEIRNVDEAGLIKVISSIITQQHDFGVRREQAERNAYNSTIKKDSSMFFSDKLRLYKVLFENDFRLYSTIPFFYLYKTNGWNNKIINPNDFINISASDKYQVLKNSKDSFAKGDIHKFIYGFDNKIRNAGEGHDRWEITDKNTIILHNISMKDGSEESNIELSEKELDDFTEQCRKTLWILELGLRIFLENNRNFATNIKSKNPVKLKEIENSVRNFADERWFDLNIFEVDDDRTQISMTIQYRPRITGTKTQLFIGDKEAYDLIERELFIEYKFQALDIIHSALLYFDKTKLPKVVIEIINENNISLGIIEYEPVELLKIIHGKGEIPIPSKGQMPENKCRLAFYVRVPYGTKKFFEKFLDEKEKKR